MENLDLDGEMVAQGKKIPQRSEECNVALAEGKKLQSAEAAQHGKMMFVQGTTNYGATHLIEPLDGGM